MNRAANINYELSPAGAKVVSEEKRTQSTGASLVNMYHTVYSVNRFVL